MNKKIRIMISGFRDLGFKDLFIVMAMMFFFHPVSAQSSYSISPESLDDAVYSHVKVIGQDDDGFYLLQSNLSLLSERDRVGFKNRKYKISYYDFNLVQKWNKALAPVDNDANIEAVAFFNNEMLVIQSKWQKDNNVTLIADSYNNTGKASKSNIQLGNCHYGKNNDPGKIKIITSASRLMAAVYFEVAADKEEEVQVIVIDSALSVRSQQQLVIPYNNKTIEETNYALSENGDFVGLVQLNDKNPANEKKRLLQYHLFINRNGYKDFKEFAITNENKPMTEASLVIDNRNNNAVVVGFYADKNSSSGSGILFTTLSLGQDDSLHLKSYTIKGDTQLKLIGERNEEGSMGLFSYPIQRVVLRRDGGAVLIAEAAYVSEYSFYDYFTQSYNERTEYHFDNVVVIAINAQGNVEWTHVVRKNQASLDDGGFLSSFVSTLSSDKISVLYNSDISRNNEVVNYQLTAKGETSETKVIRASERVFILPRAGKQVDDETLIVPALVKKKMYLIKIKL